MQVAKFFNVYTMTGAVVAALTVLIFLVNANADYQENLCNRIEIKLNQPQEFPLVTETDVLNWLANRRLVGQQLDKIELSEAEQQLREMPQIKACEMHIDFRGTLSIDIEPYLPIARILKSNAPDLYVSKEGVLFPTSPNYSARVMLLTGDFFVNKTTMADDKSVNLLSFLNFVEENELWKAQFTQTNVDKQGQMEITPLLGDHLIEFGKAEKVAEKLRRLRVFYKQIYSVRGWDNFSRVSVAYANQVVCS